MSLFGGKKRKGRRKSGKGVSRETSLKSALTCQSPATALPLLRPPLRHFSCPCHSKAPRASTLPTFQETRLSTLRNAAPRLYYPPQTWGSKLESASAHMSIYNAGESPQKGPHQTTEMLEQGMNIGLAQRQKGPLEDQSTSDDIYNPNSSCLKHRNESDTKLHRAGVRVTPPFALIQTRRKGAHRPPAHDGSS